METKPTNFEFVSYRFSPKTNEVFFNYQTNFRDKDPIIFTESIVLPKAPDFKKVPRELFERILQNLHIALGISYYKLHCAKKVKSGYNLSRQETDFWNNFYKKGLGEFFYKNKLNPNIFLGFSRGRAKKPEYFRLERGTKFLAGVSGGKDSIVTVELFKEHGIDVSAFFVENQRDFPLVDEVIAKMEIGSLKIKRYLDKKVFDKYAGYYSGHIPVSGIYAFLGILTSALYGYSYFVVSNEFSSNFGNTRYRGKMINHQWSKSYEFEKSFQDFVKNFISPDLMYFSLMRPFYEIRIAELFVRYRKYFTSFSSCNNNFKINPKEGEDQLWCGKCPKCVFVFLLLSPFLSKEELISIFGRNIFKDIDPLFDLRDILGFGKVKPFDCVGTDDESKAAFYLSREKFRDDLAGEIFLPKIDPEDNRYFFNELGVPLKIYFKGKKNPSELIDKVFKTQESSVPDYLKFLGMKNAYILGFGKEGKITKKYLEKNFPNLKIGVGDIKTESDYLQKQFDYDLVVRSPGIPKEYVKVPYTTATNIFLSYIRQFPNVKVIGVTGTKGKSTTASLIAHILKMANKNVQLLGNIGSPMIEALFNKIEEDTIFVLELSSYQLDDIKYSPNIAVITSLFPEHMDYHRNIKDYYGSKRNILKYQTKEDHYVYNPKNKKMVSWKKTTEANMVPFAEGLLLDDSEISLKGEHNRENIRAAVSTARILNISDAKIISAVKSFKGLPHRMELVGEYSGIIFYDDAISTTPESTMSAIKSLPKIGTIFLGGQDRGYNFTKLEKMIRKYKINNIVLFPESGNRIFKNREGLNILETSSMDMAVRFAYKNTPKGEVCLLSCASPSYSLWKNFEEKGDQFKSAVKGFSTIG